ncbi:hypothetical protein JZU48_01380 [bacterium]|jgi:hypothetical protein|nr:hypothetical protein [bacterium]
MENPTQPTSEATPATHNPNLSAVPVDALISEIYRRQRFGECVALVITPDDVSEYWECDESGSRHPASRVPEAGEMHAISKAFERWQDCGGMSDIMDVCRDAWQAAQAEQLDQQGGAK